jgi:hypothetical protein
MKRIRPATVLLLASILVLGTTVAIRQRREARLREALALYKGRAQGQLRQVMGSHPSLSWPDGTPLREVIESVAVSPPARSLFPQGIPVLVDPDGLREAGRTLDSPVKAPPPDPPTAKPTSLRRRLAVVLEPLGLAAEVKDGAIVITSRRRVDQSVNAEEEE